MRVAKHWRATGDGEITCELCPHGCVLGEGATGRCKVRTVRGGELFAAGYGLVSSAAMDPIEKKPLYHFHPGSAIFSIGGWGCNFACPFCQNWTISQQLPAERGTHSPDKIVAKARSSDSVGIAYTYNEPLVGFEFVLDCAERAASAGLVNVLVTNGYIRPGPAAELLPFVDALNIDIKSIDESFYREQCRAKLGPVLDFAVQARAAGSHLEVTNLVIPGLNDTPSTVEKLAAWVSGNLGKGTPLHLSAYRPQYKMKTPPTTTRMLEEALKACRQHLSYVYLGNVAGSMGRDTRCASCGATLVERRGYATRVVGLDGGSCAACGEAVPGVFQPAR